MMSGKGVKVEGTAQTKAGKQESVEHFRVREAVWEPSFHNPTARSGRRMKR